jgi:hypothetical protein
LKRLTLAAATLVAVAVPGVAQAHVSARDIAYGKAYTHARHVFGATAVGCKLIGPNSTCHVAHASDASIRASTDVLHRMFAPKPVYRPAPAQSYTAPQSYPSTHSGVSSTGSSGGGYADVPGVPSSFAACVALRESTNGAGSSNIYGIQGPGGQGSLAEQKAAFSQMYAQRGSQPWSPYDGC